MLLRNCEPIEIGLLLRPELFQNQYFLQLDMTGPLRYSAAILLCQCPQMSMLQHKVSKDCTPGIQLSLNADVREVKLEF